MNPGSLLSQLERAGTSHLEDEDHVKRVILVNRVSLGISACLLFMTPIVRYFTGYGNILAAVVIEFCINNLVLVLNHYGKYKAAGLLLFFLQCVAVTYFAFLLGSLLQLHFMVLFLIAMTYLIFREKALRRICLAGAIITMGLLQVNYFYGDRIKIDNNVACTLQSLAIVGVIFLILIIAKPIYKYAWDDNIALNKSIYSKTMLYSLVVHELRNELFAIEHITGQFKQEISRGLDIKSINNLIKELQQLTQTANTIVNTELGMASIEAGKTIDTTEEVVNLKDVLGNLMSKYTIIAKSENLEIDVKVEENLPPSIKLGLPRFHSIIRNLMGNALKYSYPYTTIFVEVGVGIEQFFVRVSNAGDTIPDSLQKTIFEPFTTDKKRGIESTGLGMFICANAVRSLGGTISVLSKDHKTCFTVTLPLIECPEPAKDLQATSWSHTVIPKYKILIADDDRLNLSLLQMTLEETGCTVICAASGEEVLSVVHKEQPDVIILDYIMPTMDGIATTKRLKADPSVRNIPVIIATGMGYAETQTAVLEAGAVGLLTKPYSMEQLRGLLEKLIPPPATEG